MTLLSRPNFWYLFDYGMVVSTAPKASDWRALEHVTGVDLEPKTSTYWANRGAFDSGQLNPQEYWSGVLGRPASRVEVESLEDLDLAQWSHLNLTTLSVLETLQNEEARVALLSNMPVQMSKRHLYESSWTKYFSKLYISGQLGFAKPERRIFDHVLVGLDVRPEDVVFIDDSAANIASAQKLGYRTVLHTSATDLRVELSEILVC